MEFELQDARWYRALSADELEARRAEIIAETENVDSSISVEDLEAESQRCLSEIARRESAAELRSRDMSAVLAGSGSGITRQAFGQNDTGAASVSDPFDTEEYQRAFMDFVCRGVEIPENLMQRADQVTTTTDSSAAIPTTLMNEIIKKMDSYGEIWQRVRKLNVQGGVEFPLHNIKLTATWIGETETSDYQKNVMDQKIVFSYHGLECRIAQTLLSNVTALPMFNNMFVELATEAMVRALEQAIIRGNGSGKPLGILNDSRVPAANKIDMKASDLTWAGWHKKVKAKMKKSYRNGVFIMAQATWDAYIDGMVDNNGQPVARVNYGLNGEEAYRFMGKEVIIVEDDVLPDFDAADDEDAFALFIELKNYAVNSQLNMRIEKWYDYEKNEFKTKAILICDGKILDANGALIIKKEADNTLGITVVPETDTVFSVNPTALQSGVSVTDGAIAGTSKHYDGSGWAAGTWAEAEKAGNFLALDITAATGATVQAALKPSASGRGYITLDSDHNIVVRIVDKDEQKLYVKATKDGVTEEQVFSLSAMTCEEGE